MSMDGEVSFRHAFKAAVCLIICALSTLAVIFIDIVYFPLSYWDKIQLFIHQILIPHDHYAG